MSDSEIGENTKERMADRPAVVDRDPSETPLPVDDTDGPDGALAPIDDV